MNWFAFSFPLTVKIEVKDVTLTFEFVSVSDLVEVVVLVVLVPELVVAAILTMNSKILVVMTPEATGSI